jgi:glycosyltransferase involved in cell wall biosynthesis
MQEIRRLQGHGLFSFYGFASKLEKLCLRRTGGVVCITRYTRELVQPFATRTWLLPNAVDSRYFGVESRVDATKPPILLVVGLICPRKNQNFLIESLDPLAREKAIELRFLGSASEQNDYGAAFLKRVRDRPWCSHAGFVSRDGLKEELEKASMLLLPSLEDNCPMVVLEAMAGGVPVIAANVGGVPDLLDDGRTGLMVDPEDAESIQGAVRRALDSPESMKGMARTAKEEAQKRFHPRVIAAKHAEIYEEVTRKPRAG